MTVLLFKKPEENKCAHCTLKFHPRSNNAAQDGYCSYDCGVRGQPDKARRTLRRVRGDN